MSQGTIVQCIGAVVDIQFPSQGWGKMVEDMANLR